MDLLHHASFRLNTLLLGCFLGLALYLGQSLPEVYPTHFDFAGNPTTWEDRGPGMWVLLVAVGTITVGQIHLFQRFLLVNPDTTLVNVPHKEAFFRLPRERRVPVFRRLNRMLGMLNTSVLVTFIALLFLTWWSAHQPGGWQARLAGWTLWIGVAFAVVFPLVEAWLLSKVIRGKLREEGLLDAEVGGS
jgi:uncharacterized membrane protein